MMGTMVGMMATQAPDDMAGPPAARGKRTSGSSILPQRQPWTPDPIRRSAEKQMQQ
jgi:hypothetical protein